MKFTTEDDIESILEEGLRAADLKELEAHGVTPRESLERSFRLGASLTIVVEGRPAAIFGVVPDPRFPEGGLVWLLGTDRLASIQRQFLRESHQWLTFLQGNYLVLANAVHEANVLHIKWLKWLGFSFLKRVGPFIQFARVCHV